MESGAVGRVPIKCETKSTKMKRNEINEMNRNQRKQNEID